jgi:cytoskeletal protein CcmA (bactofilin family)
MWNREETKDGRPEPRVATIGNSVVIKGEITGSEDLTIDGRLEGRIDLPDHALTIGPNASIQATITAKSVTIFGAVLGTIKARERVDLRKSGSVEGTVTCGRIAVQEGAHLAGKIETQQGRRKASADAAQSAKTALQSVA